MLADIDLLASGETRFHLLGENTGGAEAPDQLQLGLAEVADNATGAVAGDLRDQISVAARRRGAQINAVQPAPAIG